MAKKLLILLIFLFCIAAASAEYNDPLQKDNLSVEEFKNQCTEVSYKDLKLNEELINKSVKLTGKVSVASDDSMIFYIDGDSDQSAYVHLFEDKDNGKFNKYEGLDATIYCRFDGMKGKFLGGEEAELTIVDIE